MFSGPLSAASLISLTDAMIKKKIAITAKQFGLVILSTGFRDRGIQV